MRCFLPKFVFTRGHRTKGAAMRCDGILSSPRAHEMDSALVCRAVFRTRRGLDTASEVQAAEIPRMAERHLHGSALGK